MKKIIIDEYTLKARIAPTIIVFLPFFIILWFFEIKIDFTFISISGVVFIAVILLLSNIARNNGKRIEEKLFIELGAAPTTILLRLNDNRIDKITKLRYYKYLSDKLHLNFPMNEVDEKENQKDYDAVYDSAVRWLRNNTRDIKEYNILFTDLINYGFVRNLCGLKKSAFILDVCSMLILIVNYFICSLFKLELVNFVLIISVFIIHIFVLLLFVNKKMLTSSAFAYARALLETCEEKI